MEVLVVGIDSTCQAVLEPQFEEGGLETLEGLFADGVAGPLESHIPPWTPSMWPSIYTGVNPGKHGIFSFLTYDGYDWDIVNASDRREPPVWELLDQHGISSVVVNVPVTHPSGRFEGALVPGYTAPEDPVCHPDCILEDIEDAIGREYKIYPDDPGEGDGVQEEYRSLIELRGEAFRYLSDRYDPEFGFVQFQATDTIFHNHPGDWDLVRTVYEAMDEELAAILETQDPDVVLVVSDHGMGRYEGYGFRVNTFLEEHGYVESTYGAGGMPTWAVDRERSLRDGDGESGEGLGAEMVDRGLSAAATVGLTTRRIGRVLDRLGMADVAEEVVPDRIIRSGQRQVDFAESTAYMRNRIELGIRINLAGRDPEGVVPPEDYDSVRQELIDLLDGVRTPDGDPVFETVAPRERYFEGPATESAVDIVTVPAEFDHFLSADLLEDVFAQPGQPWNHKRNGIVSIAGDGIDPAASLSGAHVFDIAPTVLAAFGLPTSSRMDGAVLGPVSDAGTTEYAGSETTARQKTENPEMVDRLRQLGYLDH